MMKEIEHFSHKHPLALYETKKASEYDKSCWGCGQPISLPYYRCHQCGYLLHKSCAELPLEISHQKHPQHKLILHGTPPNTYKTFRCDACGEHKGEYCLVYHCAICEFNLDVCCSSLPFKIDFGGHEHQLQLWAKKISFKCDACGDLIYDAISYGCSTCFLWIHKACAVLPASINHVDHEHHPLSLIYYFQTHYSMHRSTCRICYRQMPKKCWAYSCTECNYAIHVNCRAKSSQIQKRESDNAVNLPIAEKDVDWISFMFKEASSKKNNGNIATEIKHFSHDHELTLSHVEPKSTRHLFCNGCSYPISPPFYSCPQCNFVLHKWCAELPIEIKHPYADQHKSHKEHTFKLLPKAPTISGLFKCGYCLKYSNGFLYACLSGCGNLFLDIKCATYPAMVLHEAHPHILKMNPSINQRCNGCNQRFWGFGFACDSCDFRIDPQCSLFPRAIWHRYDKKHPFLLTYPEKINPLEEFVCEICEEDIFPSFWFYHCAICDLSIHIGCICRVENENSNVRLGASLDLHMHHPHPVTLTKKVVVAPPCEICGEFFDGLAFVCGDCDYNLHPKCANGRNLEFTFEKWLVY